MNPTGKIKEQKHYRQYAGHPALHFCWHLRIGFYRSVGTERMWAYTRFFYNCYFSHYLKAREEILADYFLDATVKKQANTHHRALRRLFESRQPDEKSLGRLEERLEAFVFFERKTLSKEPSLRRRTNDVSRNPKVIALPLTWHDRYWELE